MSFPFLTSNAFFWWLLALGIPVLIHLLNRRRHRVVKWAAMEFLLRATRESRGKKKLKHILILACRALAIAALIFAVARPLATNGLLSWGGGKLDTVILVLDRSSSMEQRQGLEGLSKRELILKKVQSSLKELTNTKLILIDSATGVPIPIASLETLSTIAQTQGTDTEASIPALIDTAIKYVLEHDTGRSEIWVASDLQQSNWSPESGKWDAIRTGLNNLTDQTSMRIIALNEEAKDNFQIRLEKAQRIDNELILEIELTQDSNQSTTEIPLTFSLNGAQSSETVNLSGNTLKFTKRLPVAGDSGYGYIQLPADSNTRDNTVYFSYGVEKEIRSAVVSQKNEAQFYLSLAAAPPGFANQQVQTYLPHQPLPWDTLSLVIWSAPLPIGDTQQPLLDFLNKGGIIAFFPPIDTSDTSFLETQWGLLNTASKDKYFIVSEWDRTDGPLKNGDDGTAIPVQKMRSIKRRPIISEDSALARWSNESPFLTRKLYGRGEAYFISTLPDYTWSNLGDADVILPLIQRLVFKGNQRFGSGNSAQIGNLPPHLEIDGSSRSRIDSATISNPLNKQYEAGIYRFGETTLAINRPFTEDLADQIQASDLDSLLSNTNYSFFEETTNSSDGFAQQLWQACLVAMLLFMIAEALLCLNPKRAQPKSQVVPS